MNFNQEVASFRNHWATGVGILTVTAIAGALVSNNVSAHSGDATVVHACVNDTTAQNAHRLPRPRYPNIDCVNLPWPLGAGWSPVDLDGG